MKVSGAFFYENIWRNKIVPCPKVQTDGTGNYFTAHSKIIQKISAPQSVNCCVTGFRRTLIRLQNRKKADQQDKSSSRTISASKVTEETWLTSI